MKTAVGYSFDEKTRDLVKDVAIAENRNLSNAAEVLILRGAAAGALFNYLSARMDTLKDAATIEEGFRRFMPTLTIK